MKRIIYTINPIWWWLAAVVLILIVVTIIIWIFVDSTSVQNINTYQTPVENTPDATYYDGAPIPSKIGESKLTLHISASTYIADTVSVTYGTKIVWVNDDNTVHTISSDNGKFDSSDILPGGQFGLVFSEPGEFNYHCKYHSSERSKLLIK